jgi:AhpD family alkylhydroperoxidase
MKESIKELIAIGASVSAHCQPCLEYHVQAAIGLSITPDEIRQAIEIGHKVEKGAMAAMKKNSEEALAGLDNAVPPEGETENRQAGDPENDRTKVLRIYDPAMCCSSGVCGPGVDPVLAGFAGTLQALARQGTVKIERYNLGQQPQAFVDNSKVKSLLTEGGIQHLPYIFINDELVFQARYPSRDELAQALGIPLETLSPPGLAIAPGEPCCGEGGCC